jgi:hypothetical protein
MPNSDAILEEILKLVQITSKQNVGDTYEKALAFFDCIKDAPTRETSEYLISQIRNIARNADIGWKIFSSPPEIKKTLSDDEQIQLLVIISTLHEFCYGAERLDEISFLTGSVSTPIRFYINSLYHFIATLYLLDKGNSPMGGMVYKTLAPMGFAPLLSRIQTVLEKPLESDTSFGETIRKIRNDFLVHGTFSPNSISSLMSKTQLSNQSQQIKLAELIWELFNHSFILKLRLFSILTFSETDPIKLMEKYLQNR